MEPTPPQPEATEEPEGAIDKFTFKIWQYTQVYVDRYAIYPKWRWLAAGVLFLFYVYRAYINQGMTFSREVIIEASKKKPFWQDSI